MGSDTTRRRFLKWTATTGVVAIGSASPAVGESGNDPTTRYDLPQVLPTPQRIEKRGKSFPLTSVVTLVASSSVDPAALREVKSVLQAAGVRKIRESKGSGPHHGPLTVYVGQPTKSPRVSEALDQMNVTFPDDLPDEGYVLATGHASGGKQVVLAGSDDTGTFYAAQTLGQLVLDESEEEEEDESEEEEEDESEEEEEDESEEEEEEEHPGRKYLPSVTITDYPDMPMRGVIEGFYGPPWSHEDRLRQVEFYGDVKNNTYIYAPKDDPYHREKWREPYPPDKLAKLEELVDRAQRNHVDFTFALSPGVSICYSRESDYQALIDKFETMYDIGVRSFSILFDDISYTDWNCEQDRQRFGPPSAKAAAKAQVHLLNRVQREFIETHEGTEPLQMVPTEYGDLESTAYKRVIRKELDNDVIVMWTGTGVVPPKITTEQTEKANELFGHDILLWDNYPVNDYDRDHLLLGPLTGREPDLAKHGLVGFTSNPMNEAAASKIPLSTIVDYTWNDEAYKPKQSWELSQRRFSDDAYQALHTFTENTRSTPLSQSLSESPELTRLIDKFWQAYESGNFDSAAKALSEEFAVTEQIPATLRAQLNDKNFLSGVEPWFEKAELYGKAGQVAVAMLVAQDAGNGEEAWRQRRALVNLSEQADDNSKHYTRAMLSAFPLEHAPSVVGEFIEQALDENNRWLGTSGSVTPITTLGTYADYVPAHMIDNNLDAFYWSSSPPSPGDVIGIDFGEIREISEINILMTKPSSPNDYIHEGVLEISTDGENWTSLGKFSDEPEISVTPPDGTMARYVRLRAIASQDFWVVVREFSVITPGNAQLKVSGNPPPAEGSSLSYAADGQPKTTYKAARAPKPDETLEVTCSSLQSLSQLIVLQDSDKAATGELQVRTDDGWITIGSLDNGYTEVDAGGIETNAVRIAWSRGSPAPVIHEIIPWFDNR